MIRRPAAAGVAAALVAAALVLGPALRAEPAADLPPGTEAYAGIPPYLPRALHDAAGLGAWCDAVVAAARVRPAPARAADLLLSAAWVLDRRLGDAEGALALYEEVGRALARDEAGGALAHLEAARLHLQAGRPGPARRALHVALGFERRAAPAGLAARERRRWELVADRVAWEGPRIAADLAEATGAHADAARRWEHLAAAMGRGGYQDERAAVLLARAARLRARAGEAGPALADIDRALELTRSERQTAEYAVWQLCLRHGLLTPEGVVGLTEARPGPDFVRDALQVLEGLQGNPHRGPHVLTLATRAWTSGQAAAALELYRVAFTDPAFVDHARGHEELWRGLLAAFPIALRLGRLEDADRILDAVAAIGEVPIDEMDGYRAAIAEARDAARAARTEPVARPAPSAPPAPPAPARGRLRPGGVEGGEREPPEARPDGAAKDGGPPRALLVAVALALAAALALRLRAGRRRVR